MARYSGYGVIGLAMVLLGVLILIPFLKQIFPQIENFNDLYKDTRLYNMLINRRSSEPRCNIVRRCPQGTVCISYNSSLADSVGVNFGDPQRNGVCLKTPPKSPYIEEQTYIKLKEEVKSIYNNYLASMQPMRDVKKELQARQEQVNSTRKGGGTAWYNSNFQMT